MGTRRARWVPLAAVLTGVALLSFGPASAGGSAAGSGSHPGIRFQSAPLAAPSAGFSLVENGSSPAAVGLTWGESRTGTFVNYTVLDSPNATGPWTSVDVITVQTTTSYVASGLTPGSTMYWMVTANYLILLTTPASQNSTVLQTVQPGLAYLALPGETSTSVDLNWTNNASYGGLISFVSYQIVERAGSGAPTVVWTGTDEAVAAATITGLTSGSSYSFYLLTTDCIAQCGTATPTLSVTQSNSLPVGVPQALSVTIAAVNTQVTQGQTDYFTCTPIGGKTPYRFSWNYGSGRYVAGIGSESRTFSSTGHIRVVCKVTDAEPANASSAITIIVVPPGPSPGPEPPLTAVEVLAVAAAAGAALAVGFLERRRRSEVAATLALPTRWVPPADPNKFVGTSKRCLRCGTPNLTIRRTCQTCGAFLPRSPGS